MSWLHVFKIVIGTMTAMIVICYCHTSIYGRALASIPGHKPESQVKMHKQYARATLAFTVANVLTIVAMVFCWPGYYVDWWVHWTHLPFSIAFILILCLMQSKFTGSLRPDIHWKLWLGDTACLCIMVILGAVLLLQYEPIPK